MKAPFRRDFAPPWRWGIFRRAPCRALQLSSSSPDYRPMNAIYAALKSAGFRETYWQFVYSGQIGGLVKSPKGTVIEFHVRFFEGGMIYAEIELGRSLLLHFVNRRSYINKYLVAMLASRLSAAEASYFLASTERYKSAYHNDWPEWTANFRYITPSMKKQIRFLTTLSDWRVLALIMLASTASSFGDRPVVLPILTATMIIIYLLAPKRSQ